MSDSAYTILIAEDDDSIRHALTDVLTASGYEVLALEEGLAAIHAVRERNFDLALLDVAMPGADGFQVLQVMSEERPGTPVIMLTARGEEEDRVQGLKLGADDYMIKPFDSKELVARVKAVLRRTAASPQASQAAPAPEGDVVSYPDLVVNLTNYSVQYMGRNVDMPPKELELLYFLASSPNRVFTREQLLDHIWGYEYIGDTRTVDVHIKRLREKIKDHPSWSIATVWGIGYKFEVKSK